MLSTVYHIRDIIGTFLKISEYLKLSYNNLFFFLHVIRYTAMFLYYNSKIYYWFISEPAHGVIIYYRS